MPAPAKTREIFEYLKQQAVRGEPVTYGEVGQAVGLPAIAVGRPLGYIRDHICAARGLPLLNALVVNKHTGIPGDSFMPGPEPVSPAENLALWEREIKKVYAFDWTSIHW